MKRIYGYKHKDYSGLKQIVEDSKTGLFMFFLTISFLSVIFAMIIL